MEFQINALEIGRKTNAAESSHTVSFVTTADTADYNLDANSEPFCTLTCFLKEGYYYRYSEK